jgi:hypothetical protein
MISSSGSEVVVVGGIVAGGLVDVVVGEVVTVLEDGAERVVEVDVEVLLGEVAVGGSVAVELVVSSPGAAVVEEAATMIWVTLADRSGDGVSDT